MIGWLAAAGCSFVLFAGLASEFVREGEYAQIDGLVAAWIDRLASPAATRFFRAVTDLHDTLPVSVAVVVIALLLLHRKAWSTAAWLLAVVPGGMLLNTAMKHLLQRPRPSLSSILRRTATAFRAAIRPICTCTTPAT